MSLFVKDIDLICKIFLDILKLNARIYTNNIRKAMKERVTIVKHPERRTFGESSLCKAIVKTVPEP